MNNLEQQLHDKEMLRMKLYCDVYAQHSGGTIKSPDFYARRAVSDFEKMFTLRSQEEENE